MTSTSRMKRILIAGSTFCAGAAITAYIGTSDVFQVRIDIHFIRNYVHSKNQ